MLRILNEDPLTGEALSELETALAALVLAAPDKAMPKLPPDSALLRHRPAIQEALAACQRGDFGAMEAQLQTIHFRSPYRDLKSMLKALVMLYTDPFAAGAVAAVLARLPANTPFERMAGVLRTAVLPDPQWVAAFARSG